MNMASEHVDTRWGPRGWSIGVGSVVVLWWAFVLVAIVFTVPAPEVGGEPSILSFHPGDVVYVLVPSGGYWLMPVDRATYYEDDRLLLPDDELEVPLAPARPGWVGVFNGQAVSVVEIDRAAVRVELLQGPSAGGRGWLKAEHLRPYLHMT
jgi:hypothetical protein